MPPLTAAKARSSVKRALASTCAFIGFNGRIKPPNTILFKTGLLTAFCQGKADNGKA